LHFTFHNIQIDVTIPRLAMLEAEVRRRFTAGDGFALATVNLDHLVKMRESEAFTRSYAAQDLIVADGWPIVTLSRLAHREVDLMPGSDLLLPLCDWAADSHIRVGLLGSTEAALTAASAALETQIPQLDIAWYHAPPMGFDPEGPAAAELLHDLESANIGLCLLALGAPKQERFAARGRQLAPSVGFASIGAGLDFLAGRQKRAPLILRRMKLEWLWRALSNPRRLILRYVKCAAILPGEMRKAWRMRQR